MKKILLALQMLLWLSVSACNGLLDFHGDTNGGPSLDGALSSTDRSNGTSADELPPVVYPQDVTGTFLTCQPETDVESGQQVVCMQTSNAPEGYAINAEAKLKLSFLDEVPIYLSLTAAGFEEFGGFKILTFSAAELNFDTIVSASVMLPPNAGGDLSEFVVDFRDSKGLPVGVTRWTSTWMINHSILSDPTAFNLQWAPNRQSLRERASDAASAIMQIPIRSSRLIQSSSIIPEVYTRGTWFLSEPPYQCGRDTNASTASRAKLHKIMRLALLRYAFNQPTSVEISGALSGSRGGVGQETSVLVNSSIHVVGEKAFFLPLEIVIRKASNNNSRPEVELRVRSPQNAQTSSTVLGKWFISGKLDEDDERALEFDLKINHNPIEQRITVEGNVWVDENSSQRRRSEPTNLDPNMQPSLVTISYDESDFVEISGPSTYCESYASFRSNDRGFQLKELIIKSGK
jgi:hypothetical protein